MHTESCNKRLRYYFKGVVSGVRYLEAILYWKRCREHGFCPLS